MVLSNEPQVPSTKEKKEITVVSGEKEKYPVVERTPPKELGPKVKDWMERLETGEEIQLPQPVTDDSGAVVVDSSAPQQVSVTLPLTEEEMAKALHQKLVESIRWLAEWCKRLLKIVRGRFTYKLGTGEG